MRVYLVRHGETIWNTEGRIQGWKNSNLTNKGIEDAKSLGKYLRDINFQCAYTSPFERAVDTTRYIIGDRKISIKENINFRELNFGLWEGQVFQDVRAKYPKEHYNLWNNPEIYEPINGEYLEVFRNRVRNGLKDVINSNYDGDILLVTHALVVKAIYSIAKELPIAQIWDTPKIGNTSLTILDIDKQTHKITIIQEASTEHLNRELV